MSDISTILAKDFPQFLDLLTQQNYVLCLPESKILNDCDFDYSFFSKYKVGNNSFLIDEHLF